MFTCLRLILTRGPSFCQRFSKKLVLFKKMRNSFLMFLKFVVGLLQDLRLLDRSGWVTGVRTRCVHLGGPKHFKFPRKRSPERAHRMNIQAGGGKTRENLGPHLYALNFHWVCPPVAFSLFLRFFVDRKLLEQKTRFRHFRFSNMSRTTKQLIFSNEADNSPPSKTYDGDQPTTVRAPLTERNKRTGQLTRHLVKQECRNQHHAHLATQASWMLQSWPRTSQNGASTSNAKPAGHVD